MARINSNIPSLIARANLAKANDDLQVHLQRLATGVRINRGADDPAGLIISERLRSEIGGLNQAVDNSQRASNVIATSEGALSEVSDLLSTIKGLIVQSSNTGAVSDDERKANQLQIDSAIDSITRISNTTSFGGLNLLNGSLDYSLSGLDTSAVSKASIFSADFSGRSSVQVNVQVLASAQTAALYLSAGATAGQFTSSTQLEISGTRGVQTIQLTAHQNLSAVVAAVNNLTGATGISASLINPADQTSGMRFNSVDYGSKSFVSVRRLGGPSDGGFFKPYSLANNAAVPGTIDLSALAGSLVQSNRDEGRDVSAIVNGNLGKGDGLNVSVQNSASLSVDLILTTSFGTTNGSSSTFNTTGGGALFQLGGDINTAEQANIGIQSIAASRLGGTVVGGVLQYIDSVRTGGSNDLSSGNFQNATDILSTSIDEISNLRGRLGAFEANTLETNVRSLQTAVENLTSSESRIRDADFADETSQMTRAQILSSAATTVLQLANQQSQSVLQLLR